MNPLKKAIKLLAELVYCGFVLLAILLSLAISVSVLAGVAILPFGPCIPLSVPFITYVPESSVARIVAGLCLLTVLFDLYFRLTKQYPKG